MTYRVIQWATGNVGRAAIEGVLAHPDLELVGAYVYSAAKAGRDVGELCGLDPIGVAATDRRRRHPRPRRRLRDLQPDAGHAERGGGAARVGQERRDPGGVDLSVREPPGRAETWPPSKLPVGTGGVSLHGTGINPGGITEQIPLLLSAFCRDIRHVRAEEFSDIRTYATEFVVREVMLFGKTPSEAAASPMLDILGDGFCQSIDMVADGLGRHPRRRASAPPTRWR